MKADKDAKVKNNNRNNHPNHALFLLKHTADVILGFIFIILFSPLFILIGMLVKLDSPGPVIFKQARLGKNFKNFQLIKFRTMDTEKFEMGNDGFLSNPEVLAEYSEFHKIVNDPRVTQTGKWLRRYSLDELPQLFNVLSGKMSLVGPRPYNPEEVFEAGNFPGLILGMKPGMTGWWQVSGRNRLSFQERIECDMYYINNWSIGLDMLILFKTIWVVAVGDGL